MSGSHKPRRSWRHRVCVPHPCNTVAERRNGGSIESALRILEEDGADPIACSTARLFRSVLAREERDNPMKLPGVRNPD